MRRRAFLRAGALAAAGVAAMQLAVRAQEPPRIVVRARKFEFSPKEIHLKAGQPVTLALVGLDFVHGFNLPDFNLRRDLVPGQVVEVTITPPKPGRHTFLCDNFCGDGHEEMSGMLIVE